jgi:2-keto-3-deoxy-L-rhamnonate aldolase RhmA
MVETAEQASAVVTAAKYPPEGERGAAFGTGHDDYEAAEDVVSGMQHASDETLLIAQIETTDGIENVEEIAALDGLDVLWIGHNDLTNSIGIPGQFDHPDYLRAVDRFLEACADNGKAPGTMSTSVEEARSQVDQGFRCVAYWGDIWLYASVLREGLERIREK